MVPTPKRRLHLDLQKNCGAALTPLYSGDRLPLTDCGAARRVPSSARRPGMCSARRAGLRPSLRLAHSFAHRPGLFSARRLGMCSAHRPDLRSAPRSVPFSWERGGRSNYRIRFDSYIPLCSFPTALRALMLSETIVNCCILYSQRPNHAATQNRTVAKVNTVTILISLQPHCSKW